MTTKTPIDTDALKRIQRNETLKGGGQVKKDSFTSRVQHVLDTPKPEKKS